jgi:hypothetical protein
MVQREMSSGLAQFEFRLGTVSNIASFENIEIWGRTKASNGEDIYFFISRLAIAMKTEVRRGDISSRKVKWYNVR